MPGFFMTMRVFYDGDCYAALPGGFKMLDYAVSTYLVFASVNRYAFG